MKYCLEQDQAPVHFELGGIIHEYCTRIFVSSRTKRREADQNE